MTKRTSRVDLYEQLASVAKALANAKRLELVELLVQAPRGVVELAEAAGLNVTTTSAHLQTLKRAGLVSAERDGTTIRYAVSDGDVAGLYAELLEVAASHSPQVAAAARAYLGPDDTEPIGRDELLRRARAGAVTVLDVRPAEEFQAGHVPGALSIPIDELAGRLDELPPDIEIVAYCRGAYCTFSHDAVRLLGEHGRRALRLVDGIVEWEAAGAPLERAA